MIDFIGRLLRFVALALVALIGLGMALIFTFSTIIAVAILFLVARLRGQRFSVQEYWTNRQAQRKPVFSKGNSGNSTFSSQPRDNVTDVEARDVR
jgi:hypothetical protein